jgi:hypothetical protein
MPRIYECSEIFTKNGDEYGNVEGGLKTETGNRFH